MSEQPLDRRPASAGDLQGVNQRLAEMIVYAMNLLRAGPVTITAMRVVRRGEDRKQDAAIFKDDLPTHPGKVEILLQYWFFYAYDEWRAPVAGGRHHRP